MTTPYFAQGCAQAATPATVGDHTLCYSTGTVSTANDVEYQSLTTDGSVEGLGIVCPSLPGPVVNNSDINLVYDNSAWERQIDSEIIHFQMSYEQAQHLSDSTAAPLVAVHVSHPAPAVGSVPCANKFAQHDVEMSSAPIINTPASSASGYSQSYHADQQLASFPDFDSSTGHSNVTAGCHSHNYSSQQLIPSDTMARYSVEPNSLSAQRMPYDPSGVLHTPHLQPSAEIADSFSRRLSVSSNAPSSMISGDCQDTPYLMTPSSTPRFAPSMSMEDPYTPMSTFSSPVYPTHSRSPSSTSLKAATPKYRPIRPAPYALDAAQRQRWSTGKTMSLPSRLTQPIDFSFSTGHMRAVSEHNVNNMYFADNFGSGDRTSFNQSLHIIRQGFPTIVPSIEKDEPEMPIIKTETPSSSSQRPKLAAIQPKTSAPVSTLSLPHVPPLNLPNYGSRPISPPSKDLSPSDSTMPKENHVSPEDTYTPKYSRGSKGSLEGFCGLCKPGRWLNMKTSAYWYDKKFNHGINPKTKRPFDLPIDRRWKMGSSVIREGLCGVCNEWSAMDSCKTSWRKWWRHAYECHNKTSEFDDFGMEKGETPFDGGSPPTHILHPNDLIGQSLQYTGFLYDAWAYPKSQDAFYPMANFPCWQE